jgi:hypothetical protein
MVPKALIAKTTQISAMAISIGHCSSAYSLPWDDDCLPTPEVNRAQGLRKHRGLQEPLHRVVDAGKDCVARKGEDHGVGVQRPQPTEGEPRQLEVEHRRRQLQGDDYAH